MLAERDVDARTQRVLRSVDARSRLADALAAMWELLLEPSWPTVRELLERDIAYRARRLAEGGLAHLFEDLAPVVTLHGHELRVRQRARATVDLDERGLMLSPSAFVAPRAGRCSTRRCSSTRSRDGRARRRQSNRGRTGRIPADRRDAS